MTQRTILFDLDGTLSDSAPGIFRSIQYAFEQLELPYPGDSPYLLGPPIKDIMAMLHCPPLLVDEAIGHYRVRYRTIGLFENTVYDGIPALLTALSANGDQLAVATSKPEVFAVQILEHFGLAEHFAFIGGATLDSVRSVKADVIAHTLAHLPSFNLANTVMVGDRMHDMKGAAAHGLDAFGVLWGYGSQEELEGSGAVATVAHPDNLASILLGL